MREKTRITENSNVWDAKTGAPVSKSRRSFMANAGMYGAGLAGSARHTPSDSRQIGGDARRIRIDTPLATGLCYVLGHARSDI